MSASHSVCLRAEQLENRILLTADSPQHDLSDPNPSDTEFRSMDGTVNNIVENEQGAALTRVIRFGYPAVYPDGQRENGDPVESVVLGEHPNTESQILPKLFYPTPYRRLNLPEAHVEEYERRNILVQFF